MFVALALSAFPLFAGNNDDFRPPTPAELQLKSTPLAPGASAVILDWAKRDDEALRRASQYLRRKNGVIDFSRKVAIQANVLVPGYYATIRGFFTKLAAADRDSVVLRKTH